MACKISDLIIPQNVFLSLKSTSKEEVLKEFVFHITSIYQEISANNLLQNLIDRENLSSTGVGNTLAIPHTSIDEISQMQIFAGTSINGVDYADLEGNLTHIFFVILNSKKPESVSYSYLQVISSICKLCKSEEVRNTLIEASTAEDFCRRLKNFELRT